MTDMVKCPVPNSCLTINPDGTLAPCCQASLPFERDDKFISLQTTDSLLNFFNSPFLKATAPPVNPAIHFRNSLLPIPPVLKGTRPPKAFS